MHTVTLGRRNLTLMAEGDAGPSDGPVLQDSAVAGNVHVGNVVHQYHVAAPVVPAVAPAATTAFIQPTGFQNRLTNHQVRHPGERALGEAYILCFFLGWFGWHRFYLGQPFVGLLYLFTFGLFGLGWLADMIRMPYMVQRYNLQRFPR